jgi:hypothetical protein
VLRSLQFPPFRLNEKARKQWFASGLPIYGKVLSAFALVIHLFVRRIFPWFVCGLLRLLPRLVALMLALWLLTLRLLAVRLLAVRLLLALWRLPMFVLFLLLIARFAALAFFLVFHRAFSKLIFLIHEL